VLEKKRKRNNNGKKRYNVVIGTGRVSNDVVGGRKKSSPIRAAKNKRLNNKKGSERFCFFITA